MKVKRWLPLILLLWALPATVQAQFTFTTNTDGSLTLIKYSGTNGSAIIPATVNGATVTGIGSYAFTYPNAPNYWPVATNIEIPATVTTLAPHAFSGMETYGGEFLMGAYFLGNAPSGTGAFDYFAPGPYTLETVIYHLAGSTGFDTNLFQGPIQVWYPGQLQAGLSPTNAILDGAQWQVDGGPWQTNGAMVVNLSAGNHTVSYKPIPGWRAPADQTVFVGTDFIATTAVPNYFPLPGGPSHTIFQILHTLDGPSYAPLLLISNTLYGTTTGTIFAINTDGTGYTNLYSFTNGGGCYAGLIQSGGVFYGTTDGTVFRINLDGTGFTNLCSGLAGAKFGVVLVGNTLYSTTSNGGGPGNSGTLFAVNTDGTGFRVLHDFGSSTTDGALPLAGVVALGNTLYGDTQQGVRTYGGFPYTIQTDGSGYTNFSYQGSYVGNLILSSNVLYGDNGGAVFRMNADGSAYTNLQSINSLAGVIVAGNSLYGTTWLTDGANQYWQPGYNGSVFAGYTDGTGYTNLYTFTGGSDGSHPSAPVLLSGTTLFGTTPAGTIFMLSFPHPQLNINLSGTNLILSWPSGVVGAGYDTFSVQSTTNLTSPSAWSALPTAPVLVNGMNTVTNPIPGTATLYRLSQ